MDSAEEIDVLPCGSQTCAVKLLGEGTSGEGAEQTALSG